MSTLEESILFAVEAHKGQIRRFDGTPFIRHPLSVMGMISAIDSSVVALSAAVLHDTVEDCDDITIEVIHERFGEAIAHAVFYATEKSDKSDGSRAFRKQIDRLHYSNGTQLSQNIKVADMLDNIPSIALYDRKFAIVYLNEKIELLRVLHKCDNILKKRAMDLISNLFEIINFDCAHDR